MLKCAFCFDGELSHLPAITWEHVSLFGLSLPEDASAQSYFFPVKNRGPSFSALMPEHILPSPHTAIPGTTSESAVTMLTTEKTHRMGPDGPINALKKIKSLHKTRSVLMESQAEVKVMSRMSDQRPIGLQGHAKISKGTRAR